ncbi:MAG: class I SAM-dependent methyltransferase, partial [Shewanella sp.]
MENTVSPSALTTESLPDGLARKVLLQALNTLPQGCLTIVERDKSYRFGDNHQDLHATLVVHHPRFYRQVLLSGSIGAGEAFIQGDWTSPDLTKVVQIFARNLALLDRIEAKLSWLTGAINRFKHVLNRNSATGSKRNILAHYDLGNAMYAQFLDKEMLYSSGLYPNEETDLEEAQQIKLKTICDRLDLHPGQTLLEIGTGWGALAIYAAKHYGVSVTTTTISDAQYA